jgi:hypothetical protein
VARPGGTRRASAHTAALKPPAAALATRAARLGQVLVQYGRPNGMHNRRLAGCSGASVVRYP